MAELKIVENATCTFCGCVCDDMELTVEGHKITKAKNACVLGKAWFLNHHIEERPVATIQGQPATLEVSTADVQHGFSAQAFNIDEPIQPGKPATIKVTPREKGQFNVECDIVCGPGHDNMQGTIIVE